MPTEELTQQEKDLIISKHKALVDELNANLPDELKIQYDEDLPNRLEDPKEVEYYKTLEKIRTRTLRQRQIYSELESRFGAVPAGKDLMNRTFIYGLKTEDTDEAREYNEQLYQKYKSNPEVIFHKRYTNVMEFNPQKLFNIIDDKQKIAEFYLNNQKLCEDAFVFASVMQANESKINPTLKSALSGMTKAIEDITGPIIDMKNDFGDAYFTFPKNLSIEQASMIISSNPQYMNLESPLRGNFNKVINAHEQEENAKDPFILYKSRGYKFTKGFFLKYKATIQERGTDIPREIPLQEGIKRRGEEGVQISLRPIQEVNEIRKINNAYDNEYLKVWQEKFSNNFNHQPFDYNRIKSQHQGNVVERFLRKTSREYKAFINQLKEYNDPNSPDYLNKNKLRQTAQAYYDHKAEQGISFANMDKTGRDRLKLVSAVIQTIDQVEAYENEVTNQVLSRLRDPEDIERESFLENEDVEDLNMENDAIDESLVMPEDLNLSR